MVEPATTPEDKAALFKKTFFSTPPEASLADIEDATYIDQVTPSRVTRTGRERGHTKCIAAQSPGTSVANKLLQLGNLWITPNLVGAE